MINTIKSVMSKSAHYVVMGSFLTKFVAFFGSIFVVRILTKQEYGLLSNVENIYSYALIFAGLGLSNSMLRYVVLIDDKNKRTYYNYVVKHSIYRNIIIASIICQ